MIEYTITLKKLIIHPGIKSIGKRAFDGLDLKYAYRTETGELVFAQELPRNENEYTDVVELGKIAKSFDGFDYSISFCENSDFRFFKNEIPKINDMLLDFPKEERLDFFKFASSLGCFSAEKMLDKKGKETQVLLAQKASSLLAQLLKTDEMKLR